MEYSGSATATRRTTSGLLALRTPVMTCGYSSSASAEPKASVA